MYLNAKLAIFTELRNYIEVYSSFMAQLNVASCPEIYFLFDNLYVLNRISHWELHDSV